MLVPLHSPLSGPPLAPNSGEQVSGGRMVIEGPDSLSAVDIYTGRLLWTREFPGLGRLYDVTKHQRGAHSIGSNFFAVEDAVYVAAGESCHLLDPATALIITSIPLSCGRHVV